MRSVGSVGLATVRDFAHSLTVAAAAARSRVRVRFDSDGAKMWWRPEFLIDLELPLEPVGEGPLDCLQVPRRPGCQPAQPATRPATAAAAIARSSLEI